MEEKEFRQLLSRAGEGKSTSKETNVLDTLVIRKLEIEASFSSSSKFNKNRKRLYDKLMSSLNIRKTTVLPSVILKYAAVVALIIATSLIVIRKTKFLTGKHNQIATIEITTKAGERKTIILPDSSTVVVNSESFLSYPEKFNGKERDVILRGEAFFKVKRNPQKPFVVKSAEIITKVLGTSFDILESEGNVTVTVATGKVKVTQASTESGVILFPNEQVAFHSETGEFTRKKTNAEFYSGWSKGIIYFNNLDLKQAFEQLEKWYNVSIECSSPEILGHTIQSKYQNKTLEYILRDMEFIFDIRYEYIDETTIVIK